MTVNDESLWSDIDHGDLNIEVSDGSDVQGTSDYRDNCDDDSILVPDTRKLGFLPSLNS